MRPLLPTSPTVAFALIASATALGIAGTDLVLPAVPSLPDVLGGTPARAQFVLAAYVAGTALGLLLFGALGARFDPRKILIVSLALYALASLAAAFAPSLDALILLRFIQGAAGAAPAVFAPGFIRALFPENRALGMLGLLGSIESLVPALAPIAGAWLLVRFGWQASFVVIGALGLALAGLFAIIGARLPRLAAQPGGGSYAALLRDPVYLRYALSQAFSLGGLLVFVFGAPAVILGPMGGQLADFVWLQVTGIAFFILGANLTGRLTDRLGQEPVILGGTILSAIGAGAILFYALLGGNRPSMLLPLTVVLNLGFGLRGPPGFLQAVLAADGDDARGAALVDAPINARPACAAAASRP
jgi:MFS transporter, DHA1 family, multidrug resistance protein